MRVTQRDLARLTGVSQAVVSVVLSGRSDSTIRVPEETRQLVLDAADETGYVANPAARGLAKGVNSLVGVFTYESVFPLARRDFYSPFLMGIEERASALECDLLLFTAAAPGGTRSMFGPRSRVKMADGLLVLGTEVDNDDIGRLVRERFPFVSLGRRESEAGPVPYIGIDYRSASRSLVARAAELGHTTVAYLGRETMTPSRLDRFMGFEDGAAETGLATIVMRAPEIDARTVLEALRDQQVTAIFTESVSLALDLLSAAEAEKVDVPGSMSIVALDGGADGEQREGVLTRFELPRHGVGARAAETLVQMIHKEIAMRQELLPCQIIDGRTLAPPKGPA